MAAVPLTESAARSKGIVDLSRFAKLDPKILAKSIEHALDLASVFGNPRYLYQTSDLLPCRDDYNHIERVSEWCDGEYARIICTVFPSGMVVYANQAVKA